MAKKKEAGYLSARESRRIAKENRKITNELEKKYKRKNVPESEYLTQMHDPRNVLEIDDLHTYFFTDVGVAKAVDGVYDDDPKSNPDAKKFDTISIDEVVEKGLGVVDGAAAVMAKENRMPMLVFKLDGRDSIARAARGEIDGTYVTV